jgi:hypothetical protein
MPSLPQHEIAALASAGAPNRQIEAALGRRMTPAERDAVDRARLVATLKRKAAKAKPSTPPDPTEIDMDIEKLLEKDALNIIAKANSGKTLSKQEKEFYAEYYRARGEAVPDIPEPTYPGHTKSKPKMVAYICERFELGQRRGYHWLDRLKSMHHPSKGWPVKAILQEIEARREENGRTATSTATDLRRELVSEQVEILKLKRHALAGDLVDRREEFEWFVRQVAAIVQAVDGWVAHETAKAPDMADAIESLADRLKELCRDACKAR